MENTSQKSGEFLAFIFKESQFFKRVSTFSN